MKAITVRQPWAWAIIQAGKDVENRSRNIAGNYRGPVVIHAGLAELEQDNMASRAHRKAHGTETPTVLDFGAALGIVDLIDVHSSWACSTVEPCPEHVGCERSAYCSAWGMGDSAHLVLANPRPFAKPIGYRGALGLWNFPDELIPEDFR